MTLLEFVNKFIFQWFFVRLTRCVEKHPNEWNVVSLDEDNQGITVKAVETGWDVKEWYSFQYWIVPLTGWNTDFKFIGKRSFLKIETFLVQIRDVILILVLLWFATANLVQAFKCPKLTNTEILLNTPKAFKGDWVECE